MKDPLKIENPSKNNNRVHKHEIRQMAYEIFAAGNGDVGNEATDWFQVEYELARSMGNM